MSECVGHGLYAIDSEATLEVPLKISASLYSRNDRPVEEVAVHLDRCGVDAFHVDTAGDLSIFDDLTKIRAKSATPFDLHVISDRPERYFDGMIAHRVEFAAFQYENLPGKLAFPSQLIERTQLGLAIGMQTPVSVFDDYHAQCSFILLMTTVPGESGGRFDPAVLERIDEVRARFSHVQIHVDGGVDQRTSESLRQLDVEWAVSGSFLLQADSTPDALLRLRTRLANGSTPVGRFMRKLNELPCISTREAESAMKILETIESRPLGFCMVVDDDGHLRAVVSDGDVRRGALRSLEEGQTLRSEWLLNHRPVMVRKDTTVNELFQLIESCVKPFGFVPVNDNDGRLLGCISLVDLMRGVG